MNLDSDLSMSVNCGNGKLRQWLIEQIDSGKYPGLVWENDEKSIFRIPWKHAGKQDYNRDEDAALFKAWALFKGKYREGIDKPDPPTWKTRLRCALNKSNDFEELVERSQLDISDPYKVYRIIPEGAKKGAKQLGLEEQSIHMNPISYPVHPSFTSLQTQVPNYMVPHERNWREYVPEQPHPEIPYSPCSYPTRNHPWQGGACENGYQITGSFYACPSSESQTQGLSLDPAMRSAEALALTDCRIHICLYYREMMVKEMTTTSPDGCRISSCSSADDKLFLHSSMDLVLFPYPFPTSQRKGMEKLPNHLERGVLLWMTPDGLYAKRLCQSRIYWEGPLAPYSDRPNKLEKEQICKLFDTQQFLSELQAYAHDGRLVPRFQIVLCFGDEFPDPQRQKKLITAHGTAEVLQRLDGSWSVGGDEGSPSPPPTKCIDFSWAVQDVQSVLLSLQSLVKVFQVLQETKEGLDKKLGAPLEAITGWLSRHGASSSSLQDTAVQVGEAWAIEERGRSATAAVMISAACQATPPTTQDTAMWTDTVAEECAERQPVDVGCQTTPSPLPAPVSQSSKGVQTTHGLPSSHKESQTISTPQRKRRTRTKRSGTPNKVQHKPVGVMVQEGYAAEGQRDRSFLHASTPGRVELEGVGCALTAAAVATSGSVEVQRGCPSGRDIGAALPDLFVMFLQGTAAEPRMPTPCPGEDRPSRGRPMSPTSLI
ncbi:IRF4 factor, partial [Polypterus senegalus]